MLTIGIDPGLAVTGYAVVSRDAGRLKPRAVGVIRTGASPRHGDRLVQLHDALGELIEAHAPEVAAVERLFFNANVKTATAVGQASGVILMALAARGIEVIDYTPPEVKLSVTGNGGASKRQVGTMVATLLGLPTPPAPPDAADACALAICHLQRSGLSAAVKRAEMRPRR